MNGLKLITHWCPSNIFAKDAKVKQFALIILNQPIKHLEAFNRLWANGMQLGLILLLFFSFCYATLHNNTLLILFIIKKIIKYF